MDASGRGMGMEGMEKLGARIALLSGAGFIRGYHVWRGLEPPERELDGVRSTNIFPTHDTLSLPSRLWRLPGKASSGMGRSAHHWEGTESLDGLKPLASDRKKIICVSGFYLEGNEDRDVEPWAWLHPCKSIAAFLIIGRGHRSS